MRRIVVLAGLVVALAAPAPALAADHLMTVNEVMLSQGGNAGAQFVELIDGADEPFPSPPYKLVVFDGSGQKIGDQTLPIPDTFDYTQPFLVASNAANLGAGREAELTVALPVAAGQVCFTQGAAETRRIHCVGWCATTPVTAATFLAGTAPADGESLQRIGTGLAVGPPTPDASNAAGGTGSCPTGGGGGPGGPGPGGPGPGGGIETPGDTRAPSAQLAARRRQDVDRVSIALTFDEAATVTVGGTLSVPGAARTFRFTAVRREVVAGQRISVRLRLGRRPLAAAKRALAARRRVSATVIVKASDAAGNRRSESRRIRLRN